MRLFRRESQSTLVWGVWSGQYSDRTLHAVFPTQELAHQYCVDHAGGGGYYGYDVEPEDMYTEPAQWVSEALAQSKAREERSRAERARIELAGANAERDRQRAEIRALRAPLPYRPTLAQMDAERDVRSGRHQDRSQVAPVLDHAEVGKHEAR